ncbi:MAG: potassium transporter [Candidatus Kapabacteria bacterium]|nr:potassium transporter [Candidatus Kapabacteria bacterium]
MARAAIDPGIGQKFDGSLGRLIDDEGAFNVRRFNAPIKSKNPYLYLMSVEWRLFFAIIFSGFIGINLFFALLYWSVGAEKITGADTSSITSSFLSAFYFSVHTFTTVGYGNMSPQGFLMNMIGVFEIFIGVLYVALITGLLYGRFSRPNAYIVYSDNVLVSPYQEMNALMFRIANARDYHITSINAEVWLSFDQIQNNRKERAYRKLKLERDSLTFFPFTWTVVHPIDDASPLHAKTLSDMKDMNLQLLILIRGHDDTFSQQVHSRFSYTTEHLHWGGKFTMAYQVAHDGAVEVFLDKINDFEQTSLPANTHHNHLPE